MEKFNYLPSVFPGECPSPALPFPSSAGNTLLQPQNTENQLKNGLTYFLGKPISTNHWNKKMHICPNS